MLRYTHSIVAVADDLKQIFITDEVKARESGPLFLKIVAKSFLKLAQ